MQFPLQHSIPVHLAGAVGLPASSMHEPHLCFVLRRATALRLSLHSIWQAYRCVWCGQMFSYRTNNSHPTEVVQGVALTGCNRTGPPCSVGHPTVHAPGPAAVDCPRARRPTRSHAGSVTYNDKWRQTTASKTVLAR